MQTKKGAVMGEAERRDELIGMTLKEALKHIDENVKIGAKGGSSYFYCGDAKVLKGNLHFVNGCVKKATEKRFEAAEARVRALIRNENIGMAGYLKHCAKGLEKIEDFAPTMEGFMEYLAAHMEKTIKTAKAVAPHREKVEQYKSLGDRQVLEAYMSVTEMNTVCVLIEGRENGWFWDADECSEAWEVVDGKLKSIKGAKLEDKERE